LPEVRSPKDQRTARDAMYFRFCAYGFLKNLRFFEPFLILFLRDANLSYLSIGLLFSVRDVSTNVLEIPSGFVADAFGRRMAMVLAFSAYIIAFVLFYVGTGFGWFALAMVLFAVGEAFRTGTHKALILAHLEQTGRLDTKASYYGRTRSASQLGSAVNALAAAALVLLSGGYRYVFLAAIVPYLLDLVNLATYPKRLDRVVRRESRGIWEQLGKTWQEFAEVMRRPAALRALVNSSGFDGFYKACKDYLQPVLESLAVALPILLWMESEQRSAIVIGVVFSLIYLLTSVASRHAGKVGAFLGGTARSVGITFFVGAGLVVAAGIALRADWLAVSVVTYLFLYVVFNIRRPLNVAFFSDQIDSRVMAAGLSVESQATTLVTAVVGPLFGAAADAVGIGAALAGMGVVMCLVGLLLYGAKGKRAPD